MLTVKNAVEMTCENFRISNNNYISPEVEKTYGENSGEKTMDENLRSWKMGIKEL